MFCYVDLVVDITKVSQFDKIKEISDLTNAILVDVFGFGYNENAVQLKFGGKTYHSKINRIKPSSSKI